MNVLNCNLLRNRGIPVYGIYCASYIIIYKLPGHGAVQSLHLRILRPYFLGGLEGVGGVPSLQLTFSPMKMDGWNIIVFPFGAKKMPILRGYVTVSFREVPQLTLVSGRSCHLRIKHAIHISSNAAASL